MLKALARYRYGLVVLLLLAASYLFVACGGGGGSSSPGSGTTPPPPGPAATFPLHTEAGKHYLVDAQGKPFLIHGDTAWSLMVQLTDAEVDQYLDDRKAKGFNTILSAGSSRNRRSRDGCTCSIARPAIRSGRSSRRRCCRARCRGK